MTTRFHKIAEQQNIPFRTLDQVREALALAKAKKSDKEMARLMLKHGRLAPDALQYVIEYANHIWKCEALGIKR